MTVSAQNFEFWTGEDKALNYTITDGAGASLLVTGFTAKWTLRDEPDSASLLHYHSGGSGITLDADIVTVTVAASDTAGCVLDGLYYTELAASTSGSGAALLAWGWATIHRREV